MEKFLNRRTVDSYRWLHFYLLGDDGTDAAAEQPLLLPHTPTEARVRLGGGNEFLGVSYHEPGKVRADPT